MNHRTMILVVAILALVLAPTTLKALVIYGYTQPALVAPGESGIPLIVSIVNNANSPILNLTIRPIFKYPFGPYNYVNSTSLSTTIPILYPGYRINLTYFISINPKAPDGIYTLEFNATYYTIANRTIVLHVGNRTVTEVVPILVNHTSTYNVTIPILGYVSFTAGLPIWGSAQSPIEAAPGIGVLPLVIPVINIGNVAASNITATLSLPQGIKPLVAKASVGYAPPGVPIYLTFLVNVTNLVNGTMLRANLTLSYFSNSTISLPVEIPIVGYVKPIVVNTLWGSVQSPIEVGPDYGVVPLVVIISNAGTSPATYVKANLTLPPGLTPVVDYTSISGLPVGTPVDLVFLVNVSNVAPGTYYGNLTLTYNGGLVSRLKVPIVISGTPQLTVQTYYTIPPKVYPGYPSVELTIYIVNAGTAAARNVTIRLIGDDYVNVVNPADGVVNVGNVPPNTPIPINFILSINSDIYRRVNANLTVVLSAYRFNKTYTLTIRINPKALIEITNVTASLSVGDSKVPIYITFTNEGNVTAHNVEAIFSGAGEAITPHVSSSNPLSALSAGRVYLGDLKPGQSVETVFLVDVDSSISPGKYPLVFTLIWNQTGSMIPMVQNYVVYVNVHPSFYQEAEAILVPSASNPASIMFYIVLILIILLVAMAARRGGQRAPRPTPYTSTQG